MIYAINFYILYKYFFQLLISTCSFLLYRLLSENFQKEIHQQKQDNYLWKVLLVKIRKGLLMLHPVLLFSFSLLLLLLLLLLEYPLLVYLHLVLHKFGQCLLRLVERIESKIVISFHVWARVTVIPHLLQRGVPILFYVLAILLILLGLRNVI